MNNEMTVPLDLIAEIKDIIIAARSNGKQKNPDRLILYSRPGRTAVF